MHSKVIQLALLIILPASLFAQKYQLSFEQKANYSVYNFTASPSFLTKYYQLKGRPGFESEIRFYFTPKQKLSYYFGVGFTKYNYRWGDFQVAEASELLPKNGFLPLTVDMFFSYNYLGLPMGVNYSLGRHWVFCGGVRVLKLLSEYSYPRYYGQKEPSRNKKTFNNEGLSNWALNLTAEAGYTLPVFKYNITWKATFEYALTDYIGNEYSHLDLFPYTFSVGADFPICSFR